MPSATTVMVPALPETAAGSLLTVPTLIASQSDQFALLQPKLRAQCDLLGLLLAS